MSYTCHREEIEHALERSYTVRQLIEKLQNEDQDARVLVSCNYGDYHRTEQALTVDEVLGLESNRLETTGYSQSGICYIGDHPDTQWLCESCEETGNQPMCPKCGKPGVGEDGDTYDADEETLPVVLIRC